MCTDAAAIAEAKAVAARRESLRRQAELPHPSIFDTPASVRRDAIVDKLISEFSDLRVLKKLGEDDNFLLREVARHLGALSLSLKTVVFEQFEEADPL